MRYVAALLALTFAAWAFDLDTLAEPLLALAGIAALGALLFALARLELDAAEEDRASATLPARDERMQRRVHLPRRRPPLLQQSNGPSGSRRPERGAHAPRER